MPWQDFCFSSPLENRPVITHGGLAVHGESRFSPPPPERFVHAEGLWVVHVHQYEATLFMAGQEFPVRPGFVSVVAPQTLMEFHFQGRSQHFYVIFELPGGSSARVPLTAMQDLGGGYDAANRTLAGVVTSWPVQRARAEASLWSFLWSLCDEAPQPASGHPAVAEARRRIEAHLGQNISIAALADDVGLSHNQLTRLFQKELGCTVAHYVASRRMERAKYLLRHTTRPVKSIAAEVGLGDLQAFNKCMRRITGTSPRSLRHGGAD